ncbi:MAG: SIS domain-containing protein [Paracoccaceae bacterium]
MSQTQMGREVQEIPDAVARLLDGRGAIAAAATALRGADPVFLATIARGSSDHAATFLQYASALLLGVPVASLAPSVASVFGVTPRLARAGCMAISQSGQSPDIVAMTAAARRTGALTLALTNDLGSPLAAAADHAIDICAGPERSVAATKTFVTSAVAALAVLAEWAGDDRLQAALAVLPDALRVAASCDWPEFRQALAGRNSLYVLGRGPGLAISNEAALKFKETCQIHAESYSSAEVLHGPVSIVEPGFPVLALANRDAAESALVSVADNLADRGAAVFATSALAGRARRIDFVPTGHGLTDPLSLVVSFYAMVERLAVERGVNPDAPRHLKKVTETL